MLKQRVGAVSPVLQPVKRELDTLAQRLNSTTDFHSAAVDAAAAMFRRFEVVQHAPARARLKGSHHTCQASQLDRVWRPALLPCVQHALTRLAL